MARLLMRFDLSACKLYMNDQHVCDITKEDINWMSKELVKSNGGATSYYELPKHATELRHLISHKSMSKARGDIFKACYRLGEKDGSSIEYDLNKIKFFIEDLIEMHKRGEHI